ncbi:putative MFS family arabinose efflux permease [Gluconobacter cerinus]|nr:putative MFS family arabinose efflux permease [Gluconobacter cerinus]
MNVVVWNSAIAGGGLLGGIMLDTWGAPSFPWAVLGLTTAGFLIAWRAHSHGFRRGHRLGHGAGEN